MRAFTQEEINRHHREAVFGSVARLVLYGIHPGFFVEKLLSRSVPFPIIQKLADRALQPDYLFETIQIVNEKTMGLVDISWPGISDNTNSMMLKVAGHVHFWEQWV